MTTDQDQTNTASEHATNVREITDLARLALIDAKQADEEAGDWRAAAESAVANLEVLVDRLRLHALPDVPTHDTPEGSAIAEFEIRNVQYGDDSTISGVAPENADAVGVYVLFEDAPSLHVEDYTTADLAEYIASELAAHHGVNWNRD